MRSDVAMGAIFETQEEGKHLVTFSSIIPNLPLPQKYQPMMQDFWAGGLFDNMDQRYFRLIDHSHDLRRLLRDEVWEQRDSEQLFEEFQAIFNHPETKSYFNKMTHFDIKTLLPALLQVEDRVSRSGRSGTHPRRLRRRKNSRISLARDGIWMQNCWKFSNRAATSTILPSSPHHS